MKKDKEKLIELIEAGKIGFCDICERDNADCERCENERIADSIIANGVTVQRWIPVTERLPKYNVDVLVYRPKMAMGIIVDCYDGFYGEDDNEWYEGWTEIVGCNNGEDEVTHWMPLPDAPKDGE